MGFCLSVCATPKDNESLKPKISYVAPGQYKESDIVTSEKNNDKFYCMFNEAIIDRGIAELEEVPVFTEAHAAILDKILVELKTIRRSLEPGVMQGSAGSHYALHVTDRSLRNKPDEDRKEELLKGKSNGNFPGLKQIKNGLLSIEIQKAKFLEPKLLTKYALVAPYVVVKIYPGAIVNNSVVNDAPPPNPIKEVKLFETLKNESSVAPKWEEVFEHSFVDEEKIALFSIGISLFYINDKDDKPWQIGKEQCFSLSSLINQKLQNKKIDFKDPVMKGQLASLMVRFQFICDLDIVKEDLLREVKVRIERASRIKEKQSDFFAQRSVRTRLITQRSGSMISTSSNHDNDDNKYFVDE